MSEIFSDYVSSLAPNGEPPDRESYDKVREHLRAALVIEIKKRGLWNLPPSYLGVAGSSWTEREALDELVQDLYTFNFVHRLRGLKNQQVVKKRPNIRGLVIRNIRNFLTDRQRKADPIGYRVFARLRAAVLQAIKREEVFVLREEEEHNDVSNDTVLGFHHGTAPIAAQGDCVAPPSRPGDFEERVRGWNDELMPDLITAEGKKVPKVVDRLSHRLVDMKKTGVDAFRFGDLVDPLKRDVRRRWSGALADSLGEVAVERLMPGEPPVRVAIVEPDDEPDGAQRFAQLLHCVSASIADMKESRTRDELWNLWLLMRGTVEAEEEVRPSNVDLGKLLGISRKRLPGLLARLRELVRRCQSGEVKGGSEDADQDPGSPARSGRLCEHSGERGEEP